MCGFVVVESDQVSMELFKKALKRIVHRGPDYDKIIKKDAILWGFNRLAIMDLSPLGNQPFQDLNTTVVCNGEIYNYPELKKMLEKEFTFKSGSDCEVLAPLYKKFGMEILCKYLDGEFACVLYDQDTKQIFAARDPIGIRPLFYGYTSIDHQIAFSSEAKGLIDLCDEIYPFPPGHYYQDGQFICYNEIAKPRRMNDDSIDQIALELRTRLEKAVDKRLQSDAPIGYLLSGGLDSSLVCALGAKKSKTPIKTFAIGMKQDPIDLKYAKEVADYIHSEHTEIIITKEDVLQALKEVIYHLETWDITTIRASIAMYLLCKAIHQQTDIKVILTGEVSDELFGYKYTDFAPSPKAFQEEAQKRIKELYMYDVLRADRCISAHALEGRVPFADLDFVEYALSINPAKKMNIYQKGKYLLRHAFEGTNLLPDSILFREKAAFSDAVGHSMVDYLKEYANSIYSDEDMQNAKVKYPDHTPFTKESLLYRDIFESYYPHKSHWIKDYWMPNKDWEHCNVDDPSARVLINYGKSGK